jgi:hypothetical protein
MAAISWARVARALPTSTWTTDLSARAATAAGAHGNDLRLALLAAAAPADGSARRQLLSEIRDSRSFGALAAFGDVSGLPDDVARDLIALIESQITTTISAATRGAYGFGSQNAGRTLVVLNITHPNVARWEPIYALLGEPLVAAGDKRGACAVLTSRADRLGADVRARLAEIASAIVNHPASPVDRHTAQPDALGPAAELAASLNSDVEVTQVLLARLLAGDADHRIWASRLALHLGPSVAAGVLTLLAQDPEPSVRASAASCVARLVADGSGDSLAVVALQRCTEDPGTKVPQSIAETMADRPLRTIVASDILRQMASHRSALVRTTVREISEPAAEGSSG